jgi:hypothetical protein
VWDSETHPNAKTENVIANAGETEPLTTENVKNDEQAINKKPFT